MQRQDDGILEPFPIWDDVRTFDGRPWRGAIDVVSAGFPCQDISGANKHAVGIDGARSGLWKQAVRIVGEVRPSFVLVENSPILTSRGLGTVLGDLASLGLNARWGVFSAGGIGAPHIRERIWILAYAKLLNGPQSMPSRCGSGNKWGGEGRWLESNAPDSRLRCSVRANSDANGVHEKRHDDCASENGQAENERQTGLLGNGTFWWEVEQPEPLLCRMGNGVANRSKRLRSIGNGQVPAVVRLAWNILSGGVS
jgi:DNA (cytosine-5)-methyltransferase 1